MQHWLKGTFKEPDFKLLILTPVTSQAWYIPSMSPNRDTLPVKHTLSTAIMQYLQNITIIIYHTSTSKKKTHVALNPPVTLKSAKGLPCSTLLSPSNAAPGSERQVRPNMSRAGDWLMVAHLKKNQGIMRCGAPWLCLFVYNPI